MSYTHAEKKAGDLILSADWNSMGRELMRLDGDKVDRNGTDTLSGPLTVKGDLGVGTTNAGAQLRVYRRQEDASDVTHGALVVGSDSPGSASLRLGYGGGYSWIQGQGRPTLAVNPRGGDVGVGTDTPKSRLSVAGGLSVGAAWAAAAAAPASSLIVEANAGIGVAAPAERLEVAGDVVAGGAPGTRFRFHTRGANAGDFLQIAPDAANGAWDWSKGLVIQRAAGNVGVGTTAPQAKLEVNGAALIGNGNNFANKSKFMAAGSLTVGGIDVNYGGGTGWNASTAGLLLETLDNTEIAVHDSADRITSLMYYQGGKNNRLTIGRDMGSGAIGRVTVNAPLEVAGDLVAGGAPGTRFIFHTRGAQAGDFLQIAPDAGDGAWEWSKGLVFQRATGNVGVGTTAPQGKLEVNGAALVGNGNNFANKNKYMAPGSLTVGGTDVNYGGGSGWTANTAGLLLETLDNTEIAVHDAGQRLASLLYYQGGAANQLTIGRDMGWGALRRVMVNAELKVTGAALVGNGNNYANENKYMAPGSLTIGGTDVNYGGGKGWTANTAGLLLETLDNTEIAVHDAGQRVASLMYYEGGAATRLTIGRDMGWGALGRVVVNADLEVAGRLTAARSNPLAHRMYPADPIVYQEIFDAKNAGAIRKLGNPGYDDTSYATNLWYARHLIRFGGNNEADENGAEVTIPAGYDTVWLRVLGDRWTAVKAYFRDGAKENVGVYTGGYRSLNGYCPDGSLSDGFNDPNHAIEGDSRLQIEIHQWVPIPARRAGALALVAKPNTNWDFWVSGLAFSRNPWAHAAQSAVGYHWAVNGGEGQKWNNHNWNQDVLAELTAGAEHELMVPVVPSGREKLLYLVEHNSSWNGTGHSGITVNGRPVERFLATWDNPFARHWSGKIYERYIAARIPAEVVGGDRFLKVRVDLRKQNSSIHFREIGTHDLEVPQPA